MKQNIAHVALVVNDYDEALDFYVGKLKFELIEDTYQAEQDKRWVVVAPPNSQGIALLLAKASKPEQKRFVGDQAGGRVFLFLSTDDFWRDYKAMKAEGVQFVREPEKQDYGTVAVFEDVYGNLWDLIQYSDDHPMSRRGC
ncbi:VOC family protein [Pseudoalteromonas viridis]|uniref:VOC family protein n=1 Tax=Pseudoalteromonas viridis TaxID=339617 RepID=A0ABX7VAH7_9GAMM|nr:VOC family protein [Pseudoalteromonas viridis]QTL37926.1 VOC family protein [Pseudoalteromonas viridis]